MGKIRGERFDLHCCEGTSDKVYHIAIEEASGGLFNVWYAHGKRGQKLQVVAKKTKDSPIALWAAQEMALKLAHEKRWKKNYRDFPGVSGEKVFPFEVKEEQKSPPVPEPEVVGEVGPTDQEAALEMVNAFFD